MDAEIIGEQDIHMVTSYFLNINLKGEKVLLQWKNLENTTLIK